MNTTKWYFLIARDTQEFEITLWTNLSYPLIRLLSLLSLVF